MAKRPDLVVMNGELKGRHFVVGEGSLRLGRSSSNDIHIPDEELSRNHCIFERSGETGIRLTDLASANGTYVNDAILGNDSVELKEGDMIEVGQVRISVGEPLGGASSAPTSKPVDLGLGTSASAPSARGTPASRRSPLANILWVVAILVASGAIALILLTPHEAVAPAKPVSNESVLPRLLEVSYEKVHADSEGIFRYALRYSSDGGLMVSLDDTTNNRRMPEKSRVLTVEDQEALGEILDWKRLKEIEGDYTGIEPDPPVLDSFLLKVVYSTGVRTVTIVNTQEPEAFAAIRKRLEDFSQVQLGVCAIAYSREELVRRSEEATELGNVKWEERDIDYGNLAAAIAAYREALFYLETVNPKPDCAKTAREGLNRAMAERDARCTDRRINAEKEIGIRHWEEARKELKVILEMVPERDDDRHRAAKGKLLEVENNLKREGGRR